MNNEKSTKKLIIFLTVVMIFFWLQEPPKTCKTCPQGILIVWGLDNKPVANDMKYTGHSNDKLVNTESCFYNFLIYIS